MRLVVTLGAAALALFVAIGIYLAPLDPSILSLQFSFSPQAFQQVLQTWQDSGVHRYRSHLPADFVLLALYGALGYAYGRHKAGAGPLLGASAAALVYALPLAALADATENVLHLVLTAGQATHWPGLYLASGLAACLKWLSIATFVVAALARRPPAA